MAKHRNRAELLGPDGRLLIRISEREAFDLVEAGDTVRLTSNEDLRRGCKLVIRLKSAKDTERVIASLTLRDMERNADAVVRNKMNRSRSKVEAWPEEHDCFAVTISAGKIFIPDPEVAAARAAAMARA